MLLQSTDQSAVVCMSVSCKIRSRSWRSRSANTLARQIWIVTGGTTMKKDAWQIVIYHIRYCHLAYAGRERQSRNRFPWPQLAQVEKKRSWQRHTSMTKDAWCDRLLLQYICELHHMFYVQQKYLYWCQEWWYGKPTYHY